MYMYMYTLLKRTSFEHKELTYYLEISALDYA